MKRVFFIIILIVFLLSLVPASVTFADMTVYSGVLDDLMLDNSFDSNNYPIDNSDYSLHLIQVAESTNHELLVYVYQPCVEKDFRASSINVSTEINDNISYRNYSLTFCNSSGTLYKYKVNGFEVSNDSVRYYLISQIMRPFNASVDTQPGNNNTVSEVPFAVSKQWKFYELNGQQCIDCVDIEVIEITDKLVGYIHYSNGGLIHGIHYNAYTDSHLVAFSTNYDIEELYEADVQWVSRSWRYGFDSDLREDEPDSRFDESFGDPVSNFTTLYASSTHSQESHALFAQNFSFNEIQSISELLNEENEIELFYDGIFVNVSGGTHYSSQARNALASKQWVLRFSTTSYRTTNGQASIVWVDRTRVSDVMILRLKFKSNGLYYNLGVVDNKQTGSSEPLGETNYLIELSEEAKSLLYILLALLALYLLIKIVIPIFKLIWPIVTFPFRLIKRLFTRNKAYYSHEVNSSKRSRYRRG